MHWSVKPFGFLCFYHPSCQLNMSGEPELMLSTELHAFSECKFWISVNESYIFWKYSVHKLKEIEVAVFDFVYFKSKKTRNSSARLTFQNATGGRWRNAILYHRALSCFSFHFFSQQDCPLRLSQPEPFKTCHVLLSVPASHSAFKSPSPLLTSKKHLEGSPSLMCIIAITYPTPI